MLKLAAPAITVWLAVAMLGCGESGSTATKKSTSPKTSTAARNRPKPQVEFPDGLAPKKLAVRDLIVGTGAVAKKGDRIAIHYVGANHRTGEEFESSWSREVLFPFQLGVGEVLKGWDRGLPGLRVGGRRELVVPPHLAYGGDPLVYVIDLVEIE